MHLNDSIYIAGHQGMVGSALWNLLNQQGYSNLLGQNSKVLDLRKQAAVELFFKTYQPKYVFLAAAKVGGIMANSQYPANFIYDNLQIQNNVLHASWKYGVKKLLFLGSSCIYPKFAPQPISEHSLLTGPLEPTNEAYAIAKIAGIKMCQAYRKQYNCNFIAVMPTNLYGPNDNYDLQNAHVLPALLRKFHEAKVRQQAQVVIWGSGTPKREFLHVNDLARACLFLMHNYNESNIINIGSGQEISIADLAHLIKTITKYSGKIVFDTQKPDGTPRKLIDTTRLNNMGWRASINLEEGITSTYLQMRPYFD